MYIMPQAKRGKRGGEWSGPFSEGEWSDDVYGRGWGRDGKKWYFDKRTKEEGRGVEAPFLPGAKMEKEE